MILDNTRLFIPGQADFPLLQQVCSGGSAFVLPTPVWEHVVRSSDLIEQVLQRSEPVYGITTGFGLNAGVRIPQAQAEELQRRLILSHCTGVGPALPDDVARLLIFLKINALAQAMSGVRPELIATLLKLLNHGALPCIPAKGSVGASGDLAPLAHLGAAMMGVGEIRYHGQVAPARAVLLGLGLEPYAWRPKEGLALINGTQASAALAITALFRAENVFASAIVAGALSIEAMFGGSSPFDHRIQAMRRQLGQIDVAAAFRDLLDGGARRGPDQRRRREQDPYSLRCQPQVMGACLDQLRHAAAILLREANSVTDNPVLLDEGGGIEVLNGGNFHAEPVGMAADNMALAIAELGSLAERRIAMMIDPRFSGLPAFLAVTEGLDSGFMIAHVTAAAVVSENKSLAHPSSVDSIPTSANQEDHVSMATHAARRLLDMVDNAATVVAIELLAACQAIDLCPEPTLAPKTFRAYRLVRAAVAAMAQDRYLATDIEAARQVVVSGALVDIVPDGMRPTRFPPIPLSHCA